MAIRLIESPDVRVDGFDTMSTTALEPARRHRPSPAEIWHPWASRLWPSTSSEESMFVEHLRRMCEGEPERYERRDVTALVTSLRCGLTADELFGLARGLRPERLLAAHIGLEDRRAGAEQAWREIVADPTPTTLAACGTRAGSIVPVVISHLTSVAGRHPKALGRAVSEADAQIVRTSTSVALLEEQLDLCIAPSERAVDIGSLVFDRRGEGAWSLGTFLAWRVGQLVPLRVAALLGEGRPAGARVGASVLSSCPLPARCADGNRRSNDRRA